MPRKEKSTYETEQEIFPTRLRQLMTERNVLQSDLAESIGVRRQTVSLYTTGQSKPDSDGVAAIARYFNVSADYLLGLSDSQSSNVDDRAIAEKLGLTDDAIKEIAFYKEVNPVITNMLSLFLCYGYLGEILLEADNYYELHKPDEDGNPAYLFSNSPSLEFLKLIKKAKKDSTFEIISGRNLPLHSAHKMQTLFNAMLGVLENQEGLDEGYKLFNKYRISRSQHFYRSENLEHIKFIDEESDEPF